MRPAARAASGVGLLAAVACSLGPGAPGLRGQYVEPGSRSPAVPAPTLDPATQAAEARRVGIRSLDELGAEMAAGRALTRTGTLRVAVVPALFSDSPEPHVTRAQIGEALFGEGPSARSVTTFYDEASRGMLRVEGEVAGWVRTSVSLEAAAGELEGHGWFGPELGAWVVDALRRADAELDFGAFDNDGPDGEPNSGDDDGVVDAVAVEYLEPAGSCGGPGIWPHLGTTRRGTADGQPLRTDDRAPDGSPIVIDAYTAESATDCTGRNPQTVEVLSHELGHVLGLPDYYRRAVEGDADGRHWTVGCFELMAAGGWGCGTDELTTGFGPTHFSPLSLVTLGWADPVRVERAAGEEFVLEPVRAGGRVLQVPLAPGSPETFYLEYRRREGFDRALPAEGVLVYHHDAFDGERPVASGEPPAYRYHLVEADGDDALRRLLSEGGDRGSASDVFAADGGPAAITADTDPSTRGHDGEPSTLTVHEIRVAGGVARVRLSVGSDLALEVEGALPARAPVFQPVEGSYPVRGGSGPYAVRVSPATGLPWGLEAAVEGGRVRVTGVPEQAGRFHAVLVVEDGGGGQAQRTVEIRVDDLALPPVAILEHLLEPGRDALEAREARYLDRSGNVNGLLDVGDLRALFQRQENH